MTKIQVLGLWLLLLCLPVPHVDAAITSPPVGESDQQTLANKEILPRVVPLVDAATITFSIDSMDIGVLGSLSQDSLIANPVFPSTPSDGQKFMLRILSSAPRALTWGSQYTGSSGVDLPAITTGGGAVDYYLFHYNTALAKWQYIPSGDVVVGGGGGGTGDFTSIASTSVPGEVVLFVGTTGKQGGRATGTGVATLTAGQLGNVPQPTGALVGDTDSQVLRNKEYVSRIVPLPDIATITLHADTMDMGALASLSQAAAVANPEGSPEDGQVLVLRIQSAEAQPLTWGSVFTGTGGVALPATTTGGNAEDYYLFAYNSTTGKWGYIHRGGGVSSGFAQYTEATLPLPCIPFDYATLIGGAGTSLYVCTQTGDAWTTAVPQTAIGSSSTNPTGIASGTGAVTGVRYNVSNVSVDKVLGLEHTLCVDVGVDGVTLTLPAAVNSPVSEYAIVICAGEGQLTLQPDGEDLLAGVNAPQSITGIRSRMDVSLIGVDWHLISTKVLSAESAGATDVIQLPVTSVRFPSANPARLDNSETNPRLLFAETPSQCAIFGPFIVPPGFTGSPSLYTVFSYAQTQVGSVTFVMDISVMATNAAAPADVNTESYDTVNTCTSTSTATTAGYRQANVCTLTNNDAMIQNALVKVKMCLNTSSTALGDVEVLHALFRYVQ